MKTFYSATYVMTMINFDANNNDDDDVGNDCNDDNDKGF